MSSIKVAPRWYICVVKYSVENIVCRCLIWTNATVRWGSGRQCHARLPLLVHRRQVSAQVSAVACRHSLETLPMSHRQPVSAVVIYRVDQKKIAQTLMHRHFAQSSLAVSCQKCHIHMQAAIAHNIIQFRLFIKEYLTNWYKFCHWLVDSDLCWEFL